MRILRILVAISLVFLLSACSCRRNAGSGENLPVAGEGGPLADVNFAFDSFALDSIARSKLASNAEWLKANPAARTQIEGHCDERGTNEYNMALGAKRAGAAQDYLRSLGVASDRMSVVSYGEELPLDPRHAEEAWAKNRRAHFNVQR